MIPTTYAEMVRVAPKVVVLPILGRESRTHALVTTAIDDENLKAAVLCRDFFSAKIEPLDTRTVGEY